MQTLVLRLLDMGAMEPFGVFGRVTLKSISDTLEQVSVARWRLSLCIVRLSGFVCHTGFRLVEDTSIENEHRWDLQPECLFLGSRRLWAGVPNESPRHERERGQSATGALLVVKPTVCCFRGRKRTSRCKGSNQFFTRHRRVWYKNRRPQAPRLISHSAVPPKQSSSCGRLLRSNGPDRERHRRAVLNTWTHEARLQAIWV